MATFDYNGINDTTRGLLFKFGTTKIKQIRQSNTSWEIYPDPTDSTIKYKNSDTGEISSTRPSDLPTIITADGVITNFDEKSRRNFSVEVGDKLLLVLDINIPQLGDVFEVNGTSYTYVAHKTIAPAETTLLYKVQVRIQ